jgi:hypothetical protein
MADGGSPNPGTVRCHVWLGILVAVLLALLLRVLFGPRPCPPNYHKFIDARILFGLIPHAGDVLTNLAIIAAGLFGWTLRRRMVITTEENNATALLIGGTVLMGLGSTYYHWAPTNATLVWDRIPMMLTILPALALMFADRVHPMYCRHALWPMTIYAIATVFYWGWLEAMGRGDELPYGVVRYGAPLLIAYLLAARPARYSSAGWMISAIVLQIPVFLFEHCDRQVWDATGKIVSGHNLKHIFVGLSMACVFTWLGVRVAHAQPSLAGQHHAAV